MNTEQILRRSAPPVAKATHYRKAQGLQITPETLSASARAKLLRAQGLLPEIGVIVKTGSPRIDIATLRESLNAPIPNQGAVGIRPGDNLDEAFQRLPITQIKQYDHNPRTRTNPAYLELKESIRSTQAKNVVLNVTRRPGETHYICAAGGNTTLMALQELWAETQDPAYATVKTLFTKWSGETTVIINHLAENENRADICFWDKAMAMVDLKARLELERGTGIMGIDTFISDIKSRGLSSNSTTVRAYFFAVEHLAPIGPWLTLPGTKVLQPRINQLKKACQTLGIPVAKVDTQIRQTLERQAALLHDAETVARPNEDITVDALATCDALDHAIATLTQLSVDEVRAMLASASSPARSTLRGAARQGAHRPQAIGHHAVAAAPLSDQASETAARAVAPQGTLQSSRHAAEETVAAPHLPPHDKKADDAEHGDTNCVTDTGKAVPVRATMAEKAQSTAGPATAVLALVREIVEFCSLQALLVVEPSMPLGYYCEMPTTSFDADAPPESGGIHGLSGLARFGWQFLVALSGQCNRELLRCLPAQSRWRTAVESHGHTGKSPVITPTDHLLGEIQMSIFDFHTVVHSPELAGKFVQLWSRVQQWIQSDPKRFAMGPAS